MKINTKHIGLCLLLGAAMSTTSCNDLLDLDPVSQITPESFYTSADQLATYLNNYYSSYLVAPYSGEMYHTQSYSDGMARSDGNTDIMLAGLNGNTTLFADDHWEVSSGKALQGYYGGVRVYNYFLDKAVTGYENGTITGDAELIKNYIGEGYFFRALCYFRMLAYYGDLPIVTKVLEDNDEVIVENSKRTPRNEVARFIISDLDKAYAYMSDVDMATTRINKDAAMLVKSRVALFEATWLQNFKGTAFVPGGEGWPGASLHNNYQYPSGNIDNEVKYFLEQAVEASKLVADKYKGSLTENTGVLQQSADDPSNPYFDMFAQEDLSDVKEVLLWRQYARGLSTHNINAAAGRGNYRIGLTRGFVQNFLMKDGTPVYAHGSYADGDGYYMGDKTVADVRVNRDPRLSIFLKEPGQKNILFEVDNNEGTEVVMEEPYPAITSGDGERGYATGYALRKGGSFNRKYYANGGGYTAAVCFRAAEALLNYMEASYLLNGTLDATAREYWTVLRQRAGISTDFDKTIAATDMSKEAENDWGAYTGGSVISDKTLYNIRRERRCEFLAEGLRYMDLCRWRSMDQLMTAPSHLEGMHLWNTPMEDWYLDDNGKSILVADGTDKANVSSKDKSEYLRPFERSSNQSAYNGWGLAGAPLF